MTAARRSVLIVDDHARFRRAAKALLAAAPGFVVVGETATGEDAVVLAARLAPAVVVMDIGLPGMDGIEATRRIVRDRPGTVVVLVSTHADADLPSDAHSCGAAGYVRKEELSAGRLERLLTS